MHRFYYEHADFKHKTISLVDAHEVHHIKDVLRLKKGALIRVFNAEQQEAEAVIERVEEACIQLRISRIFEAPQGKGARIILACAVPKRAKFEFIIEKCTELGVDEIIPLKTARTEVVFSKEKLLAKQDRFQKVAVNAAKQSGRRVVPRVWPMTSFEQVLGHVDPAGVALIPSLNGTPRHIRDVLSERKATGPVLILIGPEGDFTPDEVTLAVKANCVPVSLGSTVLKVDTAAISTVALCRFFLYN